MSSFIDESQSNKERRHHDDDSYLETHFERRHDPYQIIPCTTPALKEVFAELRYLVLCQEHPEFSIPYHINLTEEDSFDDHSLLFLLLYKPLHMFVGGTRVVLPVTDHPFFGLPSVCFEGSAFRQNFPYDLGKFVELSRFILDKERLAIARHHIKSVDDTKEFAHPFRHLVRCTVRVCHEKNFEGFIATLEESLFRRSLTMFGIPLKRQGEPVDFHGRRQGGYALISDEETLKRTHPKNYTFLTEEPLKES